MAGGTPRGISDAAAILWAAWREGRRIEALPTSCRPATRAAAYAVQADVVRASGAPLAGWKIAATSAAGQRHIGVEGPLAGPLLATRQRAAGTSLSLHTNAMRVAEAEFAFRIGRPLPPRAEPYAVDEVMRSVGALHLAIEVPDSRYVDFVHAGAPQLIADVACADWFVLGPEVAADWRALDLPAHGVSAFRNGVKAGEGRGANVLGDPRVALTWLANELGGDSRGLRTGEVVMTGTCVAPVPIGPGDRVEMDFGSLGRLHAVFTA